MDEIKPIPRNRYIGMLADALSTTKENTGVVGDFLLGDAPNTLNQMSYGFSPIRMGRTDVTGPAGALYGMSVDPGIMDVAGVAGLGSLGYNGGKALAKSIYNKSASRASRSPNIYDPKSTPQRPFSDDYQNAPVGNDGKLSRDIEGRDLGAAFIAGRQRGGMADIPLSPGDIRALAELLRVPTSTASRTSKELNGNAGIMSRSANPDGSVSRSISLSKDLSETDAARVLAHELGHYIDDVTPAALGVAGSKIPTSGIKKELLRVYGDLNTPGNAKPGRGITPQGAGYKAHETDAELMAEALRAYMVDPNYIKTVAPKTAARIREYVNTNPNVNKVIQFNQLGAGAIGAGLSTNLGDEK